MTPVIWMDDSSCKVKASYVWACLQVQPGSRGKGEETDEFARQNGLEVACAISQDDKGQSTLLAQSMDPTKDPDALPAIRYSLLDLDAIRKGVRLRQDDSLSFLQLFRFDFCTSSIL